jgi:MoxR-like ATPase
VTVNGDAGFRRKDMEGSVRDSGAGSTFFNVVAEFAAAAVNGWGCILNEVNAADPDALLWINGLLEVPFVVNGPRQAPSRSTRTSGSIVTYNPGLVGTKALPQAFKDRFFPIKLDFPPKAFVKTSWSRRPASASTPSYIERLLKYAAGLLDPARSRATLRYQISAAPALRRGVPAREAHIAPT